MRRPGADYFTCYLSSHTGCNRGCAFCHLTATGQTSFRPTTANQYVEQALRVISHARSQPPAKYAHFDFMARGEPLANPHFLSGGSDVLAQLALAARGEGLPAKFNVSTIVPQTFTGSLVDVFGSWSPTIYYSLYSTDEGWRRRWLPTAMPVADALRLLMEYQDFSKKIVKVHHCLIAGENDSDESARDICAFICRTGLQVEFNLVRYNPASPAQGVEASDERIASYLRVLENSGIFSRVKVIERVGLDVKALCGMFVTDYSVSVEDRHAR